MRFRHGGLQLDLPETWSDRSTLMFVAPPEPTGLPTGAAVHQPAEVVSVSFASAARGEPREHLEAHAKELAQIDPTYQRVEEGPWSAPIGDGWHFLQDVSVDEVRVRQLVVACQAGPVIIIASAGARVDRFQERRELLEGILASMTRGGPKAGSAE